MIENILSYFDDLKVQRGTVLTVFTTLFVFIFSNILKSLGEKISKARTRRRYRKTIVKLLADLNDDCIQKELSLERFLENFDLMGEGKLWELNQPVLRNVEFLSKLDLIDLSNNLERSRFLFCRTKVSLRRLFKKKQRQTFGSLISVISNLDLEIKNFGEVFEDLVSLYNDHHQKYNGAINNLRKFNTEFMVNHSGQKFSENEGGAMIVKVNNVFVEFHKAKYPIHMKNTHEYVVKPILTLFRNTSNHRDSLNLLNYALECSREFKNCRNINRGIVTRIKSSRWKYRKARRLLKVIIELLK